MKKAKHSYLAINGGKKTLNIKTPHYQWPIIGKSEERAIIKQLRVAISIYDKSGIFDEFETAYAKYHGRKRALLFSSGTSAIHAMYVALGLKKDDEVICPAYTFFATVTPLLHTGAKPVLCDCDVNGNIDPKEIEAKITSRTKAVIVTHMWGVPCQMDKIVRICKKNRVLLLEDCSHAHGARLRGKIVGSFGDMAAWSLQGLKNVTGGEGGILVTNNNEFYYKALLFGHYNKRCRQEIPALHKLRKYAITGMGLKQRAHPLAIALAFGVFKKLDKHRAVRHRFAKKMIKALKDFPGLVPPNLFDKVEPSWYALVFQYKPEKFGGLPIEKFFDAVKAEGLSEADRPNSTSPLNLLPLFQTPEKIFPHYKIHGFSYAPGDFPQAEKFYNTAIKFPVWAKSRNSAIVNQYIKGIKKVCNNYRQLL